MFNASNNELVRTNTLVKGAIIQIDATNFKSWYQQHYGVELGKKKALEEGEEEKKRSNSVMKKVNARDASKIDKQVEEQFLSGRVSICNPTHLFFGSKTQRYNTFEFNR